MTETITTDTRYGFDDMQVGDVVRIERGELAAEGKVTREGGGGVAPMVNTLFGQVIPDRGCKIELIRRPDPVADVITAWETGATIDPLALAVRGSARTTVRRLWPALADALDRLVQAQA
jgi:hypothetical protein